MKQTFYIPFLILFFIQAMSCKEEKKPNADEKGYIATLLDTAKENTITDNITKISNLQHTDFVINLAEDFIPEKNIIYAPTVLLAWDELKRHLNSPHFTAIEANPEFKKLNNNLYHQNVLAKDEYEVESENQDGGIFIRAYFKKQLAFKKRLQSLNHFSFKNIGVEAFGLGRYEEERAKNISILYYKNDADFILKLALQDEENEMILIKNGNNMKNFLEVVELYQQKVKEGIVLKRNPKYDWRFQYLDGDIFMAPKLSFNIEKDYKNLTGLTFRDTKGKSHHLVYVIQRNAFVLDENGASLESKAIIALADSVGEIKTPKKMLFDDDFYILVQKKTAKYPYFALKIANHELMKQE